MLRTLQLALSILLVAFAIAIVIAWTMRGDFFTIPGALVGGAATVLLILPEKERAARVWTLITYLAVAGVNVMMIVLGNVSGQFDAMKSVVAWQSAWAIVGLTLLIVVPLRDRERLRAEQRRWAAQRAQDALARENERLETRRREELLHAERIRRVKMAADQATNPGILTGYEPDHLRGIRLERHSLMFGEPGAGLSGAGFDERRVKRGQEGEVNFAKSLQKSGLTERFASFWSVHMPDDELGASEHTQADVDCVLVSGSTLWLVDMKNLRQGGVVWCTEEHDSDDSENGQAEFLVAVDPETNGYVGKPLHMSRNMAAATAKFRGRLAASGLAFEVRPVVVMMPQRDGLGIIENLFYPGEIPAVGLPTLLDWLSAEEPFNAESEESRVLSAILEPLLKDESGSAIIIDSATGRRREREQDAAERPDEFLPR